MNNAFLTARKIALEYALFTDSMNYDGHEA